MRKIVFLFLCVTAFVLSSFKTEHKFYVSVTQIDYNETEQSLQMITRFFIDDMEGLLRARYSDSLVLGKKIESSGVDEYITKYLGQKLTFTINGRKETFTFLGKEYEDDLMICYLEIENISSLDTVEISNQLLMDLFEEQQNIVHIKKGNHRKSLILEKGKDTGMLKFSK